MSSRWLEWIEGLPIAQRQPVVGYAAAILAAILGLAARSILPDVLIHHLPFITFVPPVIVAAFFFGAGPGVLAGFLGWLLARYFVIEPVGSLTMTPVALASIIPYALMIALSIGVIHLMQRANRLLREQRSLSDRRHEMRDAMFHELQHRVSNKLQIIASLLSLQRRTIADPDAKKALEEAAFRVGLIGRISRALHDPDRRGLGVASFLEQVGRDIIEQSGAQNVTLAIDSDPGIELTGDAGVPIALIIAETISNTLEHAFNSGGNGHIAIAVRRGEGRRLVITVEDDGRGVANDFDASQSSSLGLRIATTLARQLNGSYILRPTMRGAVARLEVEALNEDVPTQ